MTPRTMRRSERGVHLFWALVLALYVYGFLPTWGEPVVRWVVMPGIAASGLAMWFAAPLRRVARRVSGVRRRGQHFAELGDASGPAPAVRAGGGPGSTHEASLLTTDT